MRPHAVTQAGTNTYTYDAVGNLLTGAGRGVTYDAENRTTSVTVGGVTTTLTYDAGGRRVTKVSGSVSTTYVGRLYECTTSCGKYIFAAGTRVAIKSGTSVYYVHADHLGSSSIVTNSAGTKVEELAYEPYGRLRVRTGSVDIRYKYTGQELDDETGLAYYVARYYDPVLGRFTQADTVTAEHYSYARNNPIMFTDPTGHNSSWVGQTSTRYGGGGYSYQYNTPPAQGADTSLPDPALTMPPSWSTPDGMNLGDMGASTAQYGPAFSSQVTNVLETSLLYQGNTMSSTSSTTSTISGNAAMAAFVYSQGQYAGIFSPADIEAMTWDRGTFWSAQHTVTTTTVAVGTMPPPQIPRIAPPPPPSGPGLGFDPIAWVVGKLWAAPNTLLGLAVGGIGMLGGATPGFGHNAIEFTGFPWPGKGAITLGNVILYNDWSPTTTITSPYTGLPVTVGPHEQAHTYQYEVLGPLFLPTYFLSGGISGNNPLETSADAFATGTGSWWPW